MARIKTAIREQSRRQTRETLLDAAAAEFAQQGFEQANINTISTQAGFAKGTVYNYYPSKQALLLALIDDIARDHLECLQAAIRIVDEPNRRLERFFAAGFEYVTGHSSRARVMFNTIHGSNLKHKQHCFQAYQPMFQLVTEQILAPGMQSGVFRKARLGPTAMLIMTLYLGTASQLNDQGRPWIAPASVARFALNGLRQT